jgi:hypothetical protein
VTVSNNSLVARPCIRVRRDKKKSSHFHERSSTSSLVLGLPGETHRIIDRPSLHLPLTNRVPYSYTSKQNEVPQPFGHMPLCRSTKLTHKTRTAFFLHLMLSFFFLRNHLMLSFVNRQQQLSSPAPQLFLHSFGRSSPFPRVVVETCWVKRMMADVVTEKKGISERGGLAKDSNQRPKRGRHPFAGRSIDSIGWRSPDPTGMDPLLLQGRPSREDVDGRFATIAQKQCSVLLCFRVARAASFVGCLFLKPECVHRLWLLLAALTR